jgi:hypothetical protein
MSTTNPNPSELIEKYTLIIFELQRLQALLVYYSDANINHKVAQVADSIKRLEISKKSLALQIDKRMNNEPNTGDGLSGQEDGIRPPS